jgi:hypothetical protein
MFQVENAVALKRSEDALHENEERYRTLFDLAPVAVYSCDVSGVIREYNNRAAELWGRKPQLGDTDERFCGSFKLYRPDGSFMPHEQCPMGDVLTGKVPGMHDAEVHIERPDGSRIIVIVNIAPLKDDQGEITGAINCFYEKLESVVQKRTASLRHLSAKLNRPTPTPMPTPISRALTLPNIWGSSLPRRASAAWPRRSDADSYVSLALPFACRN